MVGQQNEAPPHTGKLDAAHVRQRRPTELLRFGETLSVPTLPAQASLNDARGRGRRGLLSGGGNLELGMILPGTEQHTGPRAPKTLPNATITLSPRSVLQCLPVYPYVIMLPCIAGQSTQAAVKWSHFVRPRGESLTIEMMQTPMCSFFC